VLDVLGQWCAIHVLDDDGRLRPAASAQTHGAAERLLETPVRRSASVSGSRSLPSQLEDGKPQVIPDLVDGSARRVGLTIGQVRALRRLGLRRLMVLPLRIHGQSLGVLYVASVDATSTYTADDVALGTRVARRCAATLEYGRLHDSVERANQAREDFVAATSHELRTPLSHIKGFVSSLRTPDAVWDAETRDDFLAETEHEADRLTGLVETLLDMSRIDSGGLDPSARVAVHARTLVQSGVERVGASVGNHPLTIQVPDDLPPVWVDASQVERVIANLLDNAAKYSPPGEPIAIVGRPNADFVHVRIEDRGLGIPPEDLDRIFEPFFREPTGGFPAKPGSGLGLTICRSIIRSQNGRIWAEPRPGGGTVFVFTLPLAAANPGRT
jgi:signal transduction histidine kinase